MPQVVKPHVEVRVTDNGRLVIGDDCTIDSYAYFQLTKPEPVVTLGRHVGIGRHCVIAAKRSIVIGDYTQIGPYCQINDQDHGTRRDDLIMNQRAVIEPVRIGSDCWFGSGVRVVKGVTIGDGAIIGAGAVVTRDVPSYAIVGGVPAKLIRPRFEADKVEFLLNFKWWDKPDEWLKQNFRKFHNIDEFAQTSHD